MVILNFTYPDPRRQSFDGYYFGGRLWYRTQRGRASSAGMDEQPVRTRRGTCYSFIDMGDAVRTFMSELRVAEGTHHLEN